MDKKEVVGILNKCVMFENRKYKAIRYEAWKDDSGKLHHSLALYDGKNSVVIAPIERIDLIETV